MIKRRVPLIALCAIVLAALACGGPVTPTPTFAPTAKPSETLSAPTLPPAATSTVVERVVTLTPHPTATIIAISATAGKPSATHPSAASATRTRAPGPTNTRQPASATAPPVVTATPAPSLPTDTPAPVIEPTLTPAPAANCDPAYPDVCIPPPPPDLDCKDVPFKNFRVLPPDPHGFDGNHDGIGCVG